MIVLHVTFQKERCVNYGLQPELRFEGANWLIHNITKVLI